MKKWLRDWRYFIRWQMAFYFRDREGWCWADLVGWSMMIDSRSFWEIFELYGARSQCFGCREASRCRNYQEAD